MPLRCRQVDELERYEVDDVVLGVQKREPAWLRFLDDVDLDAVDHRQAPPAQFRGKGLRLRIVGRRRLVVVLLAEAGVALEHHA